VSSQCGSDHEPPCTSAVSFGSGFRVGSYNPQTEKVELVMPANLCSRALRLQHFLLSAREPDVRA
jgi:hypothetical protein